MTRLLLLLAASAGAAAPEWTIEFEPPVLVSGAFNASTSSRLKMVGSGSLARADAIRMACSVVAAGVHPADFIS